MKICYITVLFKHKYLYKYLLFDDIFSNFPILLTILQCFKVTSKNRQQALN